MIRPQDLRESRLMKKNHPERDSIRSCCTPDTSVPYQPTGQLRDVGGRPVGDCGLDRPQGSSSTPTAAWRAMAAAPSPADPSQGDSAALPMLAAMSPRNIVVCRPGPSAVNPGVLRHWVCAAGRPRSRSTTFGNRKISDSEIVKLVRGALRPAALNCDPRALLDLAAPDVTAPPQPTATLPPPREIDGQRAIPLPLSPGRRTEQVEALKERQGFKL